MEHLEPLDPKLATIVRGLLDRAGSYPRNEANWSTGQFYQWAELINCLSIVHDAIFADCVADQLCASGIIERIKARIGRVTGE